MNRLINLMVLCITIYAYGCATTKHSLFPNKYMAYKASDVILITALPRFDRQGIFSHLIEVGINRFQKCSELSAIRDYDAHYALKMNNIEMPTYDHFDTAQFVRIHEITGADFILVSKVLDSKMVSILAGRDQDTGQSTVGSKVLDLKYHSVSLNITSITQSHAQGYGGSGTIAYKKSLKKICKALIKKTNIE